MEPTVAYYDGRDFKVGAVVRLRSGGPKMTIEYFLATRHYYQKDDPIIINNQEMLETAIKLRGLQISCTWFSGRGEIRGAAFDPILLEIL